MNQPQIPEDQGRFLINIYHLAQAPFYFKEGKKFPHFAIKSLHQIN